MNNIFIQEKGLVLVFTALILPVILLIGTFIANGGRFYQRHSQIEHLSRQSSQSGLLAFSEILKQQATTNHQARCQVLIPPSKCQSDNLFDFLSQSEIYYLIMNANHQNTVINNSITFGTHYDPQEKLESQHYVVTYPYNYAPGDTQVKILVEIEIPSEPLIDTSIVNAAPIKYESTAYLPLL